MQSESVTSGYSQGPPRSYTAGMELYQLLVIFKQEADNLNNTKLYIYIKKPFNLRESRFLGDLKIN